MGMLFNAVLIAILAFFGNLVGFALLGEEIPPGPLILGSLIFAGFKSTLYLAKLRGITTHA